MTNKTYEFKINLTEREVYLLQTIFEDPRQHLVSLLKFRLEVQMENLKNNTNKQWINWLIEAKKNGVNIKDDYEIVRFAKDKGYLKTVAQIQKEEAEARAKEEEARLKEESETNG